MKWIVGVAASIVLLLSIFNGPTSNAEIQDGYRLDVGDTSGDITSENHASIKVSLLSNWNSPETAGNETARNTNNGTSGVAGFTVDSPGGLTPHTSLEVKLRIWGESELVLGSAAAPNLHIKDGANWAQMTKSPTNLSGEPQWDVVSYTFEPSSSFAWTQNSFEFTMGSSTSQIWVSYITASFMQPLAIVEPVDVSDPMTDANYAAVKNFLDANYAGQYISIEWDQAIDEWDDWDKAKTILIPRWDETLLGENSLSRLIRDKWYTGGRVITFDVPKSDRADLMLWYIFAFDNRTNGQPPATQLTSPDGRAVYLPTTGSITTNIVDNVKSSNFSYPTVTPDSYANQPVYSIQDGSMLVDGTPFYIQGGGYYQIAYFDGRSTVRDYATELAAMKADGQNTVVGYADLNATKSELIAFLDAAETAGLKVFLWFRDDISRELVAGANEDLARSELIPMPWQDRYMWKILELREHPALMGYVVADDATKEFYPWIERMRNLIKHYDARNLVTATVLSLRDPTGVPSSEWNLWKQTLDFPTTYIYTMHNYTNKIPRVPKNDGTSDKHEGFDNITALSDNVRSIWGNEAFFVLWTQSHIQGPIYEPLGLTLEDPSYPDMFETMQPFTDQERLILYKSYMSGAKGQFLFHYDNTASEAYLALGRRYTIAKAVTELSPFDSLFLEGMRSAETISRPRMEATSFADGSSKAILVAARDIAKETGYATGGLGGGSMTVVAPNASVSTVYQLKGLELVPLATTRDGNSLTFWLNNFDRTTLLFMSSDGDLLTSVQNELAANELRNVKWHYNSALDVRAKTEVYRDKITSAIAAPGTALSDIGSANTKMDQAKNDIQVNCGTCLDTAFNHIRDALILYRNAHEQFLDQGKSKEAELLANEASDPDFTLTQAQRDDITLQVGTLVGLPKFYMDNHAHLSGVSSTSIGVWELGDAVKQKVASYGMLN